MSLRRGDIRILGAGAVLLLFVGAGSVYWRSQQHQMPEREVLYWHDPMVPNARFEKPGKSPFMDMQLVPVYADSAEATGVVRVDPAVTQNLGIRLGKVERMRLQPQLRAVGSVAFDDRLQQVVSARVEGTVLQLHVRAPLEPVRRGQALATVQVPEWTGAQQEYLALLGSQSEAARALLAPARERLRLMGVPQETLRRIETERRVEATTTIAAPADGVVSELGVREGTTFGVGAVLFRINGLASVWINARIPESQVSRIKIGDTAIASATAWPGESFAGTVSALLPEIDAATRTMTARLAFDNRRGQLAPGMFVSLELRSTDSSEVLVVPSESVIATGLRSVVVTVNADSSFGIAEVRTGIEQDGRTVLLEGLQEGQVIVLSGQFLIDSEANLKSALLRLQPVAPSVPGGAQGEAAVTHRAQGTIMTADLESVTIDHGPVSTLQWPAMNMQFEAPSGVLPDGLSPGDQVEFSFTATSAGYRIDHITKLPGSTRRGERP